MRKNKKRIGLLGTAILLSITWGSGRSIFNWPWHLQISGLHNCTQVSPENSAVMNG